MKGETERHKNGEVCKANCSFIPFYKGTVIPEGRPGKALSAARDSSQQSVQYWKGLRLRLMMGPVWEQFLFKELPPTHQCLCSLWLCQQDSGCDLLRPRVRNPWPTPAPQNPTNQEREREGPLGCASLTRKRDIQQPPGCASLTHRGCTKSHVSTACNS